MKLTPVLPEPWHGLALTGVLNTYTMNPNPDQAFVSFINSRHLLCLPINIHFYVLTQYQRWRGNYLMIWQLFQEIKDLVRLRPDEITTNSIYRFEYIYLIGKRDLNKLKSFNTLMSNLEDTILKAIYFVQKEYILCFSLS